MYTYQSFILCFSYVLSSLKLSRTEVHGCLEVASLWLIGGCTIVAVWRHYHACLRIRGVNSTDII
jgi:hypothetical protein